MKAYKILIIGVFFNFFSQLLFDNVSNDVNFEYFSIENITQFLIITTSKYIFWIALFFFCASSLLWIIGLKKISLSNAFSLASLNYILIYIYYSFINNNFIFIKAFSCLLIVTGIIIVVNSEIIMLKIKKKFK